MKKIMISKEKKAEYNKQFGRKVHVDHIVPLKGTLVCGLHCGDNMQLLTDSLNSKKHNSFWPDMW